MRTPFLSSPFSRWVLPLRLIGLATTLVGLSYVIVAADATAIVITVVGPIIWQAATLLEERSAEFRRMKETMARDVMLTERIDVPSWLTVAMVRERFSAANDRTFFVTLQDGYEAGIVLPAQLRAVPDENARNLPVGQLAEPLTVLNAVREDGPLLDAYEKMARRRLLCVTVLNASERLAGVVTSKELATFSPDRTPVSEGRTRMDSPTNAARLAPAVPVGGLEPKPSAAVAPASASR